MEENMQLRHHLVKLLQGGQAYALMLAIVQDLTAEEAGKRLEGLPYTIWQLLEHLRFALHDILDFSRNPDYTQPEWPKDYWIEEDAPANQEALDKSIEAIATDMEEMMALIENQENDLFTPFAHGEGQNLLREAMLIAEHNAYHLGQIVLMRRMLGNWNS